LYSVQVYPAVLLVYFISAAVILLASLASIIQVSLPYKNMFGGKMSRLPLLNTISYTLHAETSTLSN
jgi:hypothetical protein